MSSYKGMPMNKEKRKRVIAAAKNIEGYKLVSHSEMEDLLYLTIMYGGSVSVIASLAKDLYWAYVYDEPMQGVKKE